MGDERGRDMSTEANAAERRVHTGRISGTGLTPHRIGFAKRAIAWLRQTHIAGATALAAAALTAALAPSALAAGQVSLSTVPMATTQGVTFDNEYKPDAVEVKIPAGLVTKQITGDDYELTEGLFTYGLYEANGFGVNPDGSVTGRLVATGTNLADDVSMLDPVYAPFTIQTIGAQAKTVDAAAVSFSVVYGEVANPTGNPKEQGYYVYSNGSYVLATETEVVAGKTYYEASYSPSDPSAEGYYELSGDAYVLTTDGEVDPSKTYYIVNFPYGQDLTGKGLYTRSGSEGNYTYTEATGALDQATTYYTVTYDPANPSTYHGYDATTGVFSYLYETSDGTTYTRTADTTPSTSKTYYVRSYQEVPATGSAATNRLADITWTNEVNPSTGTTYLTFDTPTPSGSPAIYYLIEHHSDPITGMIYDTTQYQVQVTVTSVNGQLVPSYEVFLGSTRLFATSDDLGRQVEFSNQYALNSVLSSPTDEDVITYNGASYKVEDDKVTIGGIDHPVYEQTVTVGGVVYPVVNGEVTIGSGTYTVADGKITVDGTDHPVVTEDVVIIDGVGYPVNADQGIDLFKHLTGRNQRAGEFSYALYAMDDWDISENRPSDGAVPVVRGISGSTVDAHNTVAVTVNQIAFNEAGTYEYVLVEEGTDGASGLYFDHSVLYATASVTADNDFATYDVDWSVSEHSHATDESKFGTTYDESGLRAWASDDHLAVSDGRSTGSYTFDNEYWSAMDSTEGSALTKTLVGRDWVAADGFQIQVVAPGDAPELDFDAVPAAYRADVASHTTSESYAQTTDTAVVEGKTYYTDAAGAVATVQADDNPSELGLFEKSVTYVYTLKDATTPNKATFMPGMRTVDGTFFEGITEHSYTEAGITFTAKRTSWNYVISEVVPDDDDTSTAGIQKQGVTYDGHTVTVKVTATDNLSGQITTTSEVTGDTEFTNTYLAKVTVSPLAVTKTLKDHALAANTFPIRIQAQSAWATEKLLMTNWSTREHDADSVGEAGSFTGAYTNLGGLNSIEFTEADIASDLLGVTHNDDGTRTREYVYLVNESTDTTQAYYDWDDNTYQVTITLHDDGKGKLSTETVVRKYEAGEAGATVSTGHCTGGETDTKATVGFVNTYKASGSFAPNVTKTLYGRNAHAGEFGFTMTQLPVAETYDQDFTPAESANQTKSNPDTAKGVAGSVSFDAQTYTIRDLDEMAAAGYATKGTNGNNASYTLKFRVSESDKFVGGTYPTYNGGTSKAGKTLASNGITWGAGADATEYSYEFTVTLTDNGSGTLVPSFQYGGNATAIRFVNTYQASGTALLQVKKHLAGRELREASAVVVNGVPFSVNNGKVTIDGEEYTLADDNSITIAEGANAGTYYATSIFAFNLSSDEMPPNIPTETQGSLIVPVAQVSNEVPTADATGDAMYTSDATFGLVHFDQDDVRESPYVYVVTEDQVTHEPGYTYSPDVKLIMPQLVDNEDGTLSMRTGIGSGEYFNISGRKTTHANAHYVTYGDGEYLRLEPIDHNVIFDNFYTTDYATQTITSSKVMPEGGLASKLFMFQLEPLDYQSVKYVTVDKGTSVIIDSVEYPVTDETITIGGVVYTLDDEHQIATATLVSPLINPIEDGNEALTAYDEDANFNTQSVYLYDANGNEVTHGGVYVETTDTVPAVTKTYYTKNDGGDYVPVRGSDITEFAEGVTYYEYSVDAAYMRATNNFSSVNFGNFRFVEPGTYQYLMTEVIADGATAEINPYALAANDATVTKVCHDGTDTQYTYAERADVAALLSDDDLANLKWRDQTNYLYDDTQFLVTVTVSDYGNGLLTVSDVSYQNVGTSTADPFDPSEDHSGIEKASIARFLNHNTFRAEAGTATVTFSKQLIGRNYWVNHDEADMTQPWQVNWFEQMNLTDETYGFSIQAIGAAGEYDQYGNPVVDSATGLPKMRKVQHKVEIGDASYDVFEVRYRDGSTAASLSMYYDPSSFVYVECAYDEATNSYKTVENPRSISPTDEAFVSATSLYTDKNFTDLPVPQLDRDDGWGNYLAIVSADAVDNNIDALTAATISGDYSTKVGQELLMPVGDLLRADIYYRIYEAAPNSATITLKDPVVIPRELFPRGTMLDYGITDEGGVYHPAGETLENDVWAREEEYVPGTYVLRYDPTDEDLAIDPEVKALVDNGTLKVSTARLRNWIANHPKYEWTYKGVTYRSTPFYVRVTVTASTSSPNLIASVAYATSREDGEAYVFGTGGSSIPNFDNTYEATGTTRLDVTKDLLNYDWANTVWATDDEGNATDEGFTYTISAIGSAPLPENATVKVTKDSVGTGTMRTAQSSAITYKLTDLVQAPTNGVAEGSFIYQIRESVPSPEVQDARGLTYDESVIYAKVDVVDNMDGTLKTEVRYYTDPTCSADNEIKLAGKSTGISYEQTSDTEIDRLKTYYKLDADGKTYIKVWNPLVGSMSDYYEQKHNEGAIFTNVGLTDFTVQKTWNGVANDNVIMRVIRTELTPAEYEALPEGSTWMDVPGWENMTDNGYDDTLPTYGEGDYVWDVVGGQTHTFARGATGDEMIHTFVDLPARNMANGNYYVYGIYEVGGRDDATTDYVASYSVGTIKYANGDTVTGTIVNNTSSYNADGSVSLTAAKDLEGKEQKGRSWNDEDSFEIRLIPVMITTTEDGELTLVSEDELSEEQRARIALQPMPQPEATIEGGQYPIWTVTGGTSGEVVYVTETDSETGDSTSVCRYLISGEDGYTIGETVPADVEATAKRKGTDTAYVTSTSGYVTPSERSAMFDAIHFDVHDLIAAGATHDNNNNLIQDFYYVMRELIPDGAHAYKWEYELVPGTVGEYMRVATVPAEGVDDYVFGTTPDSTRELYVWELDGVYYDTSLDLVQVSVSDTRTGRLTTMVTHHKMNLLIPHDAEEHPNAGDSVETITFSEGSIRTQPVFDNYYDAKGTATVALEKYLAKREWTADDEFTFSIAPATGNERRPMPVLDLDDENVTPTYEGEGDDQVLVSATDGTTTVYYDGDGGVASATITLKASSTAIDDYIRAGSFSIPVELAYLSRATANSKASATFIYRISEVIPEDATANGDGTYTSADKKLIYTGQPVYARLTATDDARGGINFSVAYYWDEAGNEPVLEARWMPGGTGSSEEKSAYANFINRQTTALVLTKSWKDFGFAVQDSTFQLQRSSDGTTWADVDGATQTITAGATLTGLAKIWMPLPAYDGNGAQLRYRAVEVQGTNSAIKVYYADAEGNFVEGNPYAARTSEGGFVESVQNVYEAGTTVDLAMVKELNGRDWLDTDAFDFVIEPVEFSTYDNDESSETYGNEVPHAAADWANVHSATAFPMPHELTADSEGREPGEEGYETTWATEVSDTATASTAQASQGYLGEHQYLAPFESIAIDIHDLTLNKRTGFMTGDFYYKVSEVITIGSEQYTKAELDAMDELPEGVTRSGEGTEAEPYVYTYGGVTYDLSSHDVHIHVQGNRLGELIVTSAYDESTKGDTTTGTRFTPVVVNVYEATMSRTPNVSKLLLTRSGGSAWGTGEGQYNDFFFVQRPIGGAPFVPVAGQSIAQGTDIADEASAITALRTGRYDAAYTGDAMYTRITASSENDSARYVPTTDAEPQSGTTYYVLDNNNYTKFTGDSFLPNTTYYVATTGGRAKYKPFAAIEFTIDDLNRVSTGNDGLTYSDRTAVPAGHKYGIFEYSFNEVEPNRTNGLLGTEVDYSKNLRYDASTKYSRIVVIDRGDGTLDLLTQFADGRIGNAIKPNDDVTIYAETTAQSESESIVGKAQFTNSEVMDVDVTKDWNGTQASESVTFQLYRTSNKEMVADAENARATMTIVPVEDESQGWAAVAGAEVTIPAGAHGGDLTAHFGTMPLYDEAGSRYIYRVVEVGVTQSGEHYYYLDGDTPLYELLEYGFNPDTSGESRHFTVKNSSEYASNGTARVNVVKELEGRGWVEGDEFVYLLTPVSKTGFVPAESFEEGTKYYVKTGDSYSVAKTQPTAETFGNGTYFKHAELTTGIPMPTVTTGEGDDATTVTKDTASAVKGDGTTATGYISATQRQASFELIRFTHEDLVQIDGIWQGDFRYTVGETITVGETRYAIAQLDGMEELPEGITRSGAGTEDDPYLYTYKGVTYDGAVHDVRIHVEDDGAGNIIANVYYDNATTATAVPVYVNVYDSTGEAAIEVAKDLQGFDWADTAWGENENGFTFEIAPVGDVPVSDSADEDTSIETVAITSETAGHKTSSDVIPFSLDDMPRNNNKRTSSTTGGAAGSFVYAITEVTPSIAIQQERKLSYDGSTIYAKIVVEDNLDGTLSTTVQYYEDAACTREIKVDGASATAATFSNSAFANVDVEKIWVGEATRGANIRVIRTTAPMLAAAGIIQDASATLDQADWATYFDAEDYPYADGALLVNTGAAPAGWEFVDGTPYTFPQSRNVTADDGTVTTTGWQHTYENLPTRDEDGSLYVYGIWEGGRIQIGGNEIASVAYGYKAATEDDPARITVTNVSNYSANGSITLTVAKDLEGRDQKGRSWTADDKYEFRLIPVAPTVTHEAVDSPEAEHISEYYERHGAGTEADPFVYMLTPDTSVVEGKTYYFAIVTVNMSTGEGSQILSNDAQPMPAESLTAIEQNSTFVTPTERQGAYGPINFTLDDLQALNGGNGFHNSANRLTGEFWYVMRERIPEGAEAYNYEVIDGMRVATTKADGIDPYNYDTTTNAVRETYVWMLDGVYYDTSMDLVHIHVTDDGANSLNVSVDHHEMVDFDAESVVTFSSSATRTQPVFDNYYDANATAEVDITKTLYGAKFAAVDKAFTIRFSVATGNDRPMPVGAGITYRDADLQVIEWSDFTKAPANAAYADITIDKNSPLSTDTYFPNGDDVESESRTGQLSIPVGLANLTRPDAHSLAEGTFVYLLEEVIPNDSETEYNGQSVTYNGGSPVIKGTTTSAGMSEAEVRAAMWYDADGRIAYTTARVYVHVTAEDNGDGSIDATDVKYYWDEAGRSPILVGSGNSTKNITSAPFANTTLTSIYVEKRWTGFDYAVQDTTLQLQQTSDAVGRWYEGISESDLDAAKSRRDPNDDAENTDIRWVDSTVEGNVVTFEAGTPQDDEHATITNLPTYHVYSNLPTYDATGNAIFYRVKETDPSGVDSITTTYTTWFQDERTTAADFPTDAPTDVRAIVHVENAYEASADVRLSVVKELQGRLWVSTDDFRFVLEPVSFSTYDDDGNVIVNEPSAWATVHGAGSGFPMPLGSVDDAHAKVTTQALGGYQHLGVFRTINFDVTDLTLNKATGYLTGDFYYTMTEQLPEGITTTSEGVTDNGDGTYTYEGMTYDLTPQNVHIHVQGNKLGQLISTISYNETAQDVYRVTTDTTPQDSKEYYTYDRATDSYVAADVTDGFASGTTYFEKNGTQLVGTGFTPVVVNVYDATTTVTPQVEKELLGRDWTVGESFDFELTPIAGAPLRDAATGDEKGKMTGTLTVTRENADDEFITLSFDAMAFTLGDLTRTATADDDLTYSDGTEVPAGTKYGTFAYTINETAASSADLTIDTDTEYLVVTAIDSHDGALDLKVAYADNEAGVNPYPDGTFARFTNVKNDNIPVRKIWVDPNGHDAASISPVTVNLLRTTDIAGIVDLDVLYSDDPADAEKKAAVQAFLAEAYAAEVDADNTSVVDDHTITWTTVPDGSYTFSAGVYGDDLEHVFAGLARYDSNGAHYVYRLLEDEPASGAAYAIGGYGVAVEDDGTTYLTVTNVSAYDPNGVAVVTAVKSLTGRDWTASDAFGFRIEPVGKATYASGGAITVDTSDEAKATVPMPHALVADSEGREPGDEGYVTTWADEISDTTTARKNGGDGHTVIRTTSFDAIAFDRGNLTLVGGVWQGDFYYKVTEVIPEGATRNDDGTYTYQGVTYDSSEREVRIHVEDNGSGTIVAKVYYDADRTAPISELGTKTVPDAFYNTYDASGTVAAYMVKHLEGRAWKEGDAFRYYLRQIGRAAFNPTTGGASLDNYDDGLFPDAATRISQAVHYGSPVVNGDGDRAVLVGQGSFEMDDLTYHVATGTYSSVFVYEITEVREDLDLSAQGMGTWTTDKGLVYDTNTYYLKITATDAGDGTLSITTAYYDDAACTKELTGDKVATFSVDANGMPLPEGGDGVAQATAPVSTNTFETLTYTATKVWSGGAAPRPDIQLTLMANGTAVTTDAAGEPLDNPVTLADGQTEYAWENLPASDGDGTAITYTVTEAAVEGYTTSIAYANHSATITNTSVPSSFTITKVWNDGGNRDGLRPDTIDIALWRTTGDELSTEAEGAELVTTFTLTGPTNSEASEWVQATGDLPRADAEGRAYTYFVVEPRVPEGYTSTVNGFTVTNTKETVGVTVTAAKIWNDNNDAAGMRPSSVTVHLLANGVPQGDAIELSLENEWSHSFTGLARFANGLPITYQVTEDPVANYSTTFSRATDAETGNVTYTFTNTYDEQLLAISGEKLWLDDDDRYSTRPESVTIELYADGEPYEVGGEAVTDVISGDDNIWQYEFTDLPKYADDHEIAWSVREVEVPGYDTKRTDSTFTEYVDQDEVITREILLPNFVNIQQTTDVTVTKVWNDRSNQDGLRPDEVSLTIMAGETEVETVTFGGTGDTWTAKVEGLPTHDASGEPITYTVVEKDVPEGYSSEVDGLKVTNSIIAPSQTTSVSVEKAWSDNENKEGFRPEGVTVHLLADGVDTGESVELNAGNEWKHTFEELEAKRAGGKDIVYTVSEDEVPHYTTNITGDAEEGFVITNSRELETTSLSGTKLWIDGDNEEHARPESVIVSLYANGEPALDDEDNPITAEVTGSTDNDTWAFSFTGLQKYADGEEIAYTVAEAEDDVPANYTQRVISDRNVIINTYVSDPIQISKVWNDNNDAAGLRPDSVTIHVTKGDDVERTLVLSDTTYWEVEAEGLPVFDADGERIAYDVAEPEVPAGYTVSYEGDAEHGFVVTNTYVGTSTTLEITKHVEGATLDTHLDFALALAQGDETKVINGNQTKTITDHIDAGGSVPLAFEPIGFTAAGTYVFTITETSEAPEGWTYDSTPRNVVVTVTATGDDNHLEAEAVYQEGSSPTFTNIYNQGKMSVKATKVWDDGSNMDNLRCDVTLVLTRDTTDSTGAIVGPDEAFNALDTNTVIVKHGEGEMSYIWADLDVSDEDGNRYVYHVAEDPVPEGYTSSVTGGSIVNGVATFTVTNTHMPEEGNVLVRKVWDDADDQDAIRPDSLLVELHREGVDEAVATATLTAEDNWTYLFTGLPTQDDDNNLIKYIVVEPNVPEGYELASITPAEAQGTPTSFVITNKHESGTVTSVTVVKRWAGDEEYTKMRKDVTVSLFGTTESGWMRKFGETTLASAEADGALYTWTTDFEGVELPTHHDGEPIAYYVVEDAVPGYVATVAEIEGGFEITNTWTPYKGDIHATKDWIDEDNLDGIRPEAVRFSLMRLDPETGEVTRVEELDQWVSEAEGWSVTWENVPDDGCLYSVQETGYRDAYGEHDGVPAGYNALVECAEPGVFTIHNTHDYDVATITASKVWADNDDALGARPAFVTLHLYADGEEVGSARTASAPTWQVTWTVPMYRDGALVTYTVEEEQTESLADYSVAYVHEEGSYDWTIVNTYDTNNSDIAKAEVAVTKVWNDSGHESERPGATIHLLRRRQGDDQFDVIDDFVVTPDAEGSALTRVWTDLVLAEEVDGAIVRYDYAVSEDPVDGYERMVSTPMVTTAEDGHTVYDFTVTNSYLQTPEPVPPVPPTSDCKVIFVDSFGPGGEQILKVIHYDTAAEAAAAVQDLAAIAPDDPNHEDLNLFFVGWNANLDVSDSRGDWVVPAYYTVRVKVESVHCVSFIDPLMGAGRQLVKTEKALQPWDKEQPDSLANAGNGAEQQYPDMEDVTPPADPDHVGMGYYFTGWSDPYVDACDNWIYVANYRRIEPEPDPNPPKPDPPTPTPDPPAPKPTPILPETSDLVSYGTIIALVIAGALALVMGYVLRRRGK